MAKEYLFVDAIAEKWGVSKSWVYRLCRQGRVSGAFFKDGRWSVPADADKPSAQPSKRIRLLRSKKITLPRILPLRFSGEPEEIPASTEKLFASCAEYIIDFVDLSPGIGRTLFCALAYPHVKAIVVCENRISYCWLSSLKNSPSELYSKVSLMLFEYFARQLEARKSYFDSVRNTLNTEECRFDEIKCAAYALFVSLASSGSELLMDENGNVISAHGRKRSEPELLQTDFTLLSSLLERAIIYPDISKVGDNLTIPEYSTLHISEKQHLSGEYQAAVSLAERVFVI